MMRTGTATRQQAILQAIGPSACLTTAEIAAAIERPHNQVATATGELVRQDIVQRIERGCFQLTAKGKELLASGKPMKSGRRRKMYGMAKPRACVRQRVWNAMRCMHRFTAPDLVLLASGDDSKRPEATVQRFLHQLQAVGYVVELPDRKPGSALTSNGFKVFRLARDTGEVAPTWSVKYSRLFDHNTREFVSCV